MSSWGSFIYGDFYRPSGKSPIPTLHSPSWGILVILNAVCVIWWVGQGEEGQCRGFGNGLVT